MKKKNIRRQDITWLIIILFFVMLVACSGWKLAFGIFRFYDDEGALLMAFRDFLSGARFYDDVRNPYGPVYPAFYYGLHQLGFPLTHVTARWLTWGCWLLASCLTGGLVWRASGRQYAPALLAFFLSATYLWPILAEPMHPASQLVVILIASAWVGYELLVSRACPKSACF